MPKVLPSTVACLDKMEGMRGEALQYRDAIFKDQIKICHVEKECQPMLQLLAQQTQLALDQRTYVGDVWHGQGVVSKYKQNLVEMVNQEVKVAEVDAASRVQILKKAGVQTIQMDVAVSEQAAVLVGYNLSEAMQSQMGALWNDCLYKEHVVSQDSVLYQAETKYQLKQDTEGKPLLATSAQVDASLDNMKQSLQKAGITLSITAHPYQEVKATTEEAAVSEKAVKGKKLEEGQTRPT